jgi:hypothetical protein
MKDEVNYLQSKGMNAAFLGEEQLDESLKETLLRKASVKSYTAHLRHF